MNILKIEPAEGYRNYYAGSIMPVSVSWQVEKAPSSLQLRLFWFTRGKGTVDSETVFIQEVSRPQAHDRREFNLQLPNSPFSFSGKLISLIWALELVIQPGNLVERLEFVMSSTGYEVELAAQTDLQS